MTTKAAPNSEDAKKKFRAAMSRACFNRSTGEWADKEFATKSSLVKAAYNAFQRRTANAWEADSSEFQTALHIAMTLKTMEPLAKFLESKKPLTRSDRLALARLLRSLEAPKVGRPRGPLSGDVNAAEKNAVYWVWLGQKKWLEKNKRQRVPASVTTKLIADASSMASEAFKLPSKLSSDVILAKVNKTSRKIIG